LSVYIQRNIIEPSKGGKELVWWGMPVIPALGRVRQEDLGFEDILGNMVSSRPAWTT
jgi:hypothetical protein